MGANDVAWRYFARVVDAIGRRTIGRSFDELMAIGCDVVHVPLRERELCITFDDGPDETLTPLILEALEQCAVKATFFCVGQNAQKFPRLLRSIHAAGHEIGNHSMTHRDFHRLSGREIRSEVSNCQSVLQDILGAPVNYFRAPYGHNRWELRDPARFGLQRLVNWNVAPHWLETTPAYYADYMHKHVKQSSILMLHDNLFDIERVAAIEAIAALAQSLEKFVPQLAVQGYAFRTVSEALSPVS